MIASTQLPNGVRVITRQLPQRHSAALGVWLRNGTRHEADHESGYAHLLEHLLFKGTAELDAAALARRFDAMGGQVNAFTGRELTAYHGLVPTGDVPELLRLFIAMLRRPRFTDADLAVEKQVVFQEMAMVEDSPEEALEELGIARAWRDHPMGRPVLGEREQLAAADAAGIRGYLNSILSGERLYIVAVGEVDHAALVTAAQELADLPAAAPAETRPPVFHPGRYLEEGGGEQTPLLWLLPCPTPTDPDYYAAVMANHLLGGGGSSRLFQALRENSGLVYGIHSRLEPYSDTGLWLIQTACDPQKADLCRQGVEDTVAELLAKDVSHEELEMTRRYVEAGLLIEDDDPEASMERLARESIYLQNHPSLEERLARLREVGPAQLRAALARAWEKQVYISAS